MTDIKVHQDSKWQPEVKPEMKDASVQTMGEARYNRLVPGTMFKDGMLIKKGETEASGMVLTARTGRLSQENWQYPNFISKAYGEQASVKFVGAIGVFVKAFHRCDDEQDVQELSAAIKKHLTDRDEKRAIADEFRRLMRAEKQGR